jgi:hypothetical protein
MKEAEKHFKDFFNPYYYSSNIEQVEVAGCFNRWINEDEARALYEPVSEKELKLVLNLFKREKSPGPDGWTVEFYLHFFDLIKDDLLNVVEDVRISGRLAGSLNSTFLALIPKINNPQNFGDFRPISLCNLVYKIISKVLAIRIKPVLSKTLSAEQFGFLEGRQIHDAIGTTHECIHSIKKGNKKALILKLDLQKAYDHVDWDFLRLILLQVGFGVAMTNWIMACVNSTSMVVLVNGEATNFFRSGRGLRQGCLCHHYFLF